jgi:hypothetical protein
MKGIGCDRQRKREREIDVECKVIIFPKNVPDNAVNLPTLQSAPSVWIDHLELRLDASVMAESLLRRIRRLCLDPKKPRLLTFGEESEELGDWDFLLLILFLFINGFHTIFFSSLESFEV